MPTKNYAVQITRIVEVGGRFITPESVITVTAIALFIPGNQCMKLQEYQ
jgi:hypothetical protein